MNSSMIAINRPSNELPAKSQTNQKAASGSDVFGNLLKQKLSSNVSDANEFKADTVKKPNALRDLQTRRMNKPEITVNGQGDLKDQTSSIDANKSNESVQEVKLDNTQAVEQIKPNENAAQDGNSEELVSEKSLEDKAVELVKELIPMLELLKLVTDDVPVKLDLNLTQVEEPTKELQLAIEKLKGVLTDLSLKLNNVSLQGANDSVENLQALSSEVETLLQTMLKAPSETSVNANDFAKLLDSMEKTIEKVQSVLPQVQKQTSPVVTQEKNLTDNHEVALPTNEVQPQDKTQANGSKDKQQNTGNEKFFAKTNEKVESKPSSGSHQVNLGEFQAKMESASVAFNTKVDMPQSGKMTLQQMIMDQLTNTSKMQVRTTEAGTMMSMKLNPEVLGNVEIKLEIVKNVLQAEINVENMIVKGAIESNLSDLKNALSDKGYQVDQLSVSVGDKQSNNQGRQQGQNQEASKWQLDDLDEKDVRQMKFRDLTDATLSYLG